MHGVACVPRRIKVKKTEEEEERTVARDCSDLEQSFKSITTHDFDVCDVITYVYIAFKPILELMIVQPTCLHSIIKHSGLLSQHRHRQISTDVYRQRPTIFTSM